MRRLSFMIVFLALIMSCGYASGSNAQQHVQKTLPLDRMPGITKRDRTNSLYMHDRIIIKLMPKATTSLSKSLSGIQAIAAILSRVSVTSDRAMFVNPPAVQKKGDVDLSQFYVVQFSSPNDPFALTEELSKLPEVQYAEPWYIATLTQTTSTPNDPLYTNQWGLKKIKAEEAWGISKGDSTVVIAIVDTGVDILHPDLAANIWTNPGEVGLDTLGRDKRTNGVDDDNNTYIDDVHGWDFAGGDYNALKGDNDPSPHGSGVGHGTIVAGIAASVTNNGIGVASIGYKCKILPVKCAADNDTRSGGSAFIANGYEGIVYAAKMGAKVINCSWASPGGSQAEQDIINFATQQGALVVGAAGNDYTNSFNSPAGYENVLGVMASDNNDLKASFSNYGDYFDVSAPGINIFSTMYDFYDTTHPHTYTSFFGVSGTSVASPFAAGLAGLVKSRFPHFTPQQVAEQIRVNSDNIDALNPSYAGQLGHGRINALRALTDTTLPSVRMLSYDMKDYPGGNGDGFAQKAETLTIRCQFENFLARTSPGSTIQLKSLSPYITIIDGAIPIGVLNTLESISNNASPFCVYVQPSAPSSHLATLQIAVTSGSFTDTQNFSFMVNQTYQTHNVNAIRLTLTNNGALGFFDYPSNKLGEGFIFHGVNHLFEGGLIIASSPTRVVNVVRDVNDEQTKDFFSSSLYKLDTPGSISSQDGFTSFTDANAPAENKIGLSVEMYSYAYNAPTDSRYILLRYDIKNTSPTAISNLYAGIFLDWDIGDYNKNIVRYDASRSLSYTFETGDTARKEYFGIRAVDSAASSRALVNNMLDVSRAAKWQWLSGGVQQAQAGPADIHHVLSSGPYSLNPGAKQIVGFALVVGDSSLANLQQNADVAKAKWKSILKVVDVEKLPEVPRSFSLDQNYPNPFNPRTTIAYRIPERSIVTLKLFDLLGREVLTLVNEEQLAGAHALAWDAAAYPSGVYFYRIEVHPLSGGRMGSFVETRKLILMR
ncbi:MAG: S8 family serine peptidase [bacterium]